MLLFVVVVVVVVVARKRARKYYSNNSLNPHVIDMICERVFKSFLRFFGRELKRKAKEKTLLAFLIRKLSFCSFLSRVKNTKATDKERRCFFQKTDVSQELLLSKKCLHSCRFYKYKTIVALFFFCSLRRDALPFALSALSLFALRGGVCCCCCF